MKSSFLSVLAIFIASSLFLIGCGSKEPTISEEEQETTREHKRQYEENTEF